MKEVTSYLRLLRLLKLKEQSFKKMNNSSIRNLLEDESQEVEVEDLVVLTLSGQALHNPWPIPEVTRPIKVQLSCPVVESASV